MQWPLIVILLCSVRLLRGTFWVAGQVGRAGRFGTKGLAITFVASEQDSAVLNQVQERFDVDIKPLPDTLDKSVYMNSA